VSIYCVYENEIIDLLGKGQIRIKDGKIYGLIKEDINNFNEF